MKLGRDKEVEQIVLHDRVVEVAMLIQGKRDRIIKPIFHKDYKNLPNP